MSKTGVSLKILTVWQQAPDTSDKAGRVVVDAEATPDAAQGPFALELWRPRRLRTITLSSVVFL